MASTEVRTTHNERADSPDAAILAAEKRAVEAHTKLAEAADEARAELEREQIAFKHEPTESGAARLLIRQQKFANASEAAEMHRQTVVQPAREKANRARQRARLDALRRDYSPEGFWGAAEHHIAGLLRARESLFESIRALQEMVEIQNQASRESADLGRQIDAPGFARIEYADVFETIKSRLQAAGVSDIPLANWIDPR